MAENPYLPPELESGLLEFIARVDSNPSPRQRCLSRCGTRGCEHGGWSQAEESEVDWVRWQRHKRYLCGVEAVLMGWNTW